MTDIHVVETKDGTNKATKPLVIASLAVVLLLVLGMLVFGHRSSDAPHATIDKNLPTDYVLLTAPQIRNRLLALTGLDITTLAQKPLTAGRFKNFDQAYQTAQAYRGLRDYKHALAVYGIAEAKPNSNKPYQFYERYAAVAAVSKQPKLVKELQDKEIAAIKTDTNLSATAKQQLTDTIGQQQRLAGLGY